MLRYVSFVVLCAAVLLTNVLSAQQKSVRGLDPTKPADKYIYTHWQIEQGLPQNNGHCMLQTRDGYLWVGTQEGLARFDGVRFTVFNRKSGALKGSNWATVLYEDTFGTLWVGTNSGGVHRLQDGRWKYYTRQEGMPSNEIYTICADNKGNIWVGTGKGIAVIASSEAHPKAFEKTYITANIRTIEVQQGKLLDEFVNTLASDSLGGMWIGTSKGLCYTDGIRWQQWTRTEGLPNSNIRKVYTDRNGTLWIGTNGTGICHITAKEREAIVRGGKNTMMLKSLTPQDTTAENPVRQFLQDREGTLWIATEGKGILRWRDADAAQGNDEMGAFLPPITVEEGLLTNRHYSLAEDAEGGMWIGTQSMGICHVSNGQVRCYTKQNGLSTNRVRTIFQDPQGVVWCGTDDGGLNYFTNGVWKAFRKIDGLLSEQLRGMHIDNQGRLWVGSADGVHCINKGKIQSFTEANGLPSKNVRTVLITKQGIVCIGTTKGLLLVRQILKNTLVGETLTVKNGLPSSNIRALAEDSRENLWIGTSDKGFCIIGNVADSTKRYISHHFDKSKGLPADRIYSVLEDTLTQTTWIPTDGGIARLRNGKITAYTTKEGLYDDLAFSMIDDGLGYFWVSCNAGIYRVSKQELNDFADGKITRVSCTSFGTVEGMKIAECNGGSQPAAWKMQDGTIWFPTPRGLVQINPRDLYKNPVPPNVIVEELRVDGTLSTTATLPSTAEKLEFQYTATCLTAAERVKFKYILEGYDMDWVEAGNRRTAYYNNLPRGRSYRFRVIACNNDGVWNETGAWAEFRITPYWWETWWFYGLCVMFVSGSAYQGFRWRTSRLRAKAQELERIVDVRTKEVQEQAREIQLANTQLSEKNAEITASRERLEVMSEVGRSLTSSLTVETIVTRLYERVSELMTVDMFGIGLARYDRHEIEYKLVIQRGNRLPPYTRSLDDKEQFPVICIERNEPIFINNLDAEGSRYFATFRESVNRPFSAGEETDEIIQSMIYVPLVFENKVIGILSAISYRINAYLPVHLETLKTLANYAAIAIANAESTEEIIRQKAIVEEFNRNIQDSIRYAKRIQDAMLPSTETLNRLLPEHFIFFRPKDVVSGDFYWCKEVQGKVFVAAVDCTGHGVPGAFMSLIGNSLLNDITQRLLDPHPDLILNELHHELQRVLRQRETNNDDGMDICLCMIDLDTRIVEFAGAMNPLYAVVQGELREWKGTPEELGGREERSPVYTRHTLDLSDVPEGASMLYLTSDGYKDQYNESRQRFMPKRLRPLLTEIAAKPLEEQPRLLGAAIDAHRGDVLQVDDMLVLGVRL